MGNNKSWVFIIHIYFKTCVFYIYLEKDVICEKTKCFLTPIVSKMFHQELTTVLINHSLMSSRKQTANPIQAVIKGFEINSSHFQCFTTHKVRHTDFVSSRSLPFN